jgi:hypothetical protein
MMFETHIGLVVSFYKIIEKKCVCMFYILSAAAVWLHPLSAAAIWFGKMLKTFIKTSQASSQRTAYFQRALQMNC